MKKITSTSLFFGLMAATSFAQDGDCIAFENGKGDYGAHCYNSGLLDMEDGACYTMNPDRKAENPQWINNMASQSWWWVETDCGDEPSVESSSSETPAESGSSEGGESGEGEASTEISGNAEIPEVGNEGDEGDDAAKPVRRKVVGFDNGTTGLVGSVELKAGISFSGRTLNVVASTIGNKTLKIFSMNGKLLGSESFTESSKSFNMSKYAGKGALVVRLSEGRKVLATKQLSVR